MKKDKNYRRIVILSEQTADEMKLSEYKFNFYVRKFLKELLDDPVNTNPSDLMVLNGFNRKRLLDELMGAGMLKREERICDKDENGNPKTAVMSVKFSVPRKDFKKNLRHLFDRLIGEGRQRINEEGEGGGGGTASSGYGEGQSGATSTSTVGNYTYDVPLFGRPITPGTYYGRKKKKRKKKDPAYDRTPGDVAVNRSGK